MFFPPSAKTKELTKLQDLKVEDSGEGLSFSRPTSESKGNDKKKKYMSRSESMENK